MQPTRRREIVPNTPHHVVIRGNNRRRIFSFQPEYALFVSLLGKSLEKTGCKLHAASLLSNHVHLLLTPSDAESLSTCVQYFCQRYAQIRNKRREATGKLFEHRFFSAPIKSDEQLAIVTAYIDMNAEISGVKMAMYPTYPWSTYAIHAGISASSRVPQGMWTPSAWYLSLGANAYSRAQMYQWFANNYADRAKDIKYLQRLHEKGCASVSQKSRIRFERPDGTRAL